LLVGNLKKPPVLRKCGACARTNREPYAVAVLWVLLALPHKISNRILEALFPMLGRLLSVVLAQKGATEIQR
jgi:hypothetical protein